MSVQVFKSKLIREQLAAAELFALTADFKQYKQTGAVPATFGRDVAYDHPYNLPIVIQEELRHIHLLDPSAPWPIKKIQFHKTSDIHLVYCQGAINSNCFVLIAVLSPDAHNQARKNDMMYKLGKIAELFRQQY